MAEIYTGYKTVRDDDANLSNFYSDKNTNWFNLLENQYLIVADGNGNAVDEYKWQDGKHKKVTTKSLESTAMSKIKPLNVEQKLAIDLLLDNTITVKLLAGGYGAGKDLLMAASAFNLIQSGAYDRLIWVRNNVEVKDSCNIGFLPGGLEQKLRWVVGPLIDHLGGDDALEHEMSAGRVEVMHLGHIRGRDIRNSIIVCSEAENLTRQHVQLLLGRVAAGSALFMNFDLRQTDSKVFEVNSGARAAVDCLKDNRLFGYVYMPHSVRSETAKLADLLD